MGLNYEITGAGNPLTVYVRTYCIGPVIFFLQPLVLPADR